MCSSHGALFRISDGECVLGPCLGEKLMPLLIEVRDGDVFLMDRL
jgi:nitrite reductase/ring-hydroxylating ferredoxin subunit